MKVIVLAKSRQLVESATETLDDFNISPIYVENLEEVLTIISSEHLDMMIAECDKTAPSWWEMVSVLGAENPRLPFIYISEESDKRPDVRLTKFDHMETVPPAIPPAELKKIIIKGIEKGFMLHSLREYELLLSAIPSIIIGLTTSLVITKWNKVAAQTFGLSENEVLGKKLVSLPVGWDSSCLIAAEKKCLWTKDRVRLDDVIFKRPDGKSGILGLNLNMLRSEKNELQGYLLMGAEITSRKKEESEIAQAQKLESIGQLAAGVAHEINTPIQFMGDNTRFVNESWRDISTLLSLYEKLRESCAKHNTSLQLIEELSTMIDDIDLEYLMEELPLAIEHNMAGIERVTKIVRAMKEFSHPGSQEMSLTDINKTLENIITISKNEWKYVAQVKTDFAGDLPKVPCLPGEINQVFLNLIINAAHAIGDKVYSEGETKGSITITTVKGKNHISVSVADTGNGIEKKIQGRIFDPFFTTKEIGKGTGQGLAICHSIVTDKHGGKINYETAEGKGTTFNVQLPLKVQT